MRRAARWLSALAVGAAVVVSTPMASPGVASSPDGRIAFVGAWLADGLNDDLYRVDVASGETVNLTRTELASESSAAVSPDGSSIVFAVGFGRQTEAIWRMNADGSGRRRVASGHSPAWSPDGRWLAYVRDGVVFTAAADGSGERRLADGVWPAWSPDGRSIALVVHGTPRSSLLLAAADGTSIRSIYADANIYAPVAWSPDGAHVLVWTGVSLATVPVSGGDVRIVPGAWGRASWSPDGSRIAFVKLPSRIYVMPIAGGDAVAVTNPPHPYGDFSPSWSPDGRAIVFVRGQDTKHGLRPVELMTVSAEGGATQHVADLGGNLSGVVWVGSGSLVYSRSSMNNSGIISVRPDGTARRRLALGGSEPTFSPDGRSIAFVRSADGQSELFVMDAEGGAVRRLTEWPGADHSPSWSPDGSRIVFVRHAAGEESALYTIRPDGTHLAALRAPPGLVSPAWSPDGRTIAAVRWGFSRPDLVSVATATGRVRELVRSVPAAVDGELHVKEPAWHPNGERLSFVRTSYCTTARRGCGEIRVDLWTVGRQGAAPRLLLRRVAEAAWSQDGNRLVVAAAPSGAMRIHASGGKVLRKLPVSGTGVTWQPRCTVSGTQGADRLSGIGASPLVCGLGGDDRLAGGPGRDRLFGGDGDDAIVSRGGGFDVVGCGPGADAVHADRSDYVGVDCERVTRR